MEFISVDGLLAKIPVDTLGHEKSLFGNHLVCLKKIVLEYPNLIATSRFERAQGHVSTCNRPG